MNCFNKNIDSSKSCFYWLLTFFTLFFLSVFPIYSQVDYQVSWDNIDMGSDTWCVELEDSRTVSVTITNTGDATWNTNGQTTNLGVRWMDNGGGFNPWTDYFVRVSTGQLAPGESETFELTIEAKEATAGPVYGNPLPDGTYFLAFDVVNEGECWFGNNNGICGPGNSVFTSPAIDLYNNCIYFCEDGVQDLESPHDTDNVLWYDSNDDCVEPIYDGPIYSPFLDETTLYYTNGFDDDDVTVGQITGNPLSGNFAEVGQMFDIEAPADKDVIVNAITVVKRAASQQIRIYYRPESYENYWQGQDQAGWITLVDEFSASGSTSSFSLANPVEIPAGCRFGFYIHADVNYTTNVNTVTNGDIILLGGHGGVTSSTPFVMMQPRAFSGDIDYIVRPYTEKVPFLAKKLEESVAPSAIDDGGADYCEGDEVDLVVQGGSLNEGSSWEWFESSCGAGAPIATGDTLTITATSATSYFVRASESGLCPATECVEIQLDEPEEGVTVSGGGSEVICLLDDFTVSGVTVDGGTVEWSHDGDGTLINETTITPTYQPGPGDANQTITLTMEATSTSACEGTASLTIELAVDADPEIIVTPGEDEATICANESHEVTSVSVLNANLSWTHDGAGELQNTTTLNPIYIADEADAGNVVTLTLTAISDNSCDPASDELTYTITVEELPELPSLSYNDPLCEGDDAIVVISGEPNLTVTYLVDGGDETTVSLDADGEYEIQFDDVAEGFDIEVTEVASENCSVTVDDLSLTIEINPLPAEPTITSNTPICEGESGEFVIQGDPESNVTYSLDGGTTVETVELNGDGEYVVELDDLTENVTITLLDVENEICTLIIDDVESTLDVHPLPTSPIVVTNSPVCIGEDAQVSVIGVEDETFNYTINGGSVETASFDQTGTFEFTIEDVSDDITIEIESVSNDNCSTELDGVVSVIETSDLPTADIISEDAEYCDYETPDGIQVAVSGVGPWEVTYLLDGQEETASGMSSPVNLGNSEGTYELTAVSDAACSNTALGTAVITIKPSPDTPVVESTFEFCLGDEIEGIEASDSQGEYEWYVDEDLTDLYGEGSVLNPTEELGTTTYYVVTIDDDCVSLPNQTEVSIIACEIEVPTAFTPNGDGMNDVWELPLLDALHPNNTVKVFNRWGDLLYEHDSSSQGPYNDNPWDGTFKGELLPVGSYLFIIEFNDTDSGVFNGAVSILYN